MPSRSGLGPGRTGDEPDSDRVTVLVADDNSMLRLGLKAALEAFPDLSVVAEAWDGDAALLEAKRHSPDVTLLDIRMPGRDGLSVVSELSALSKVIMLTQTKDAPSIASALKSGACGYLVHDGLEPKMLHHAIIGAINGVGTLSVEVLDKIRSMGTGESEENRHTGIPRSNWKLSSRQEQVVDLLSQGMTNMQIANRLFLTEKTVKNTVYRAYIKMNVSNRAEAAASWLFSYDDTQGRGDDFRL